MEQQSHHPCNAVFLFLCDIFNYEMGILSENLSLARLVRNEDRFSLCEESSEFLFESFFPLSES